MTEPSRLERLPPRSVAPDAAVAGPIAVVIPAHDEENVLRRCLDAALAGARPGELDVVVVCNGCADRTADVARTFGDRVRVIETETASKTNALNLGDDAARGYPRFYVDADVVLPLDSIRKMAAALSNPQIHAASPTMDVDLSASSWPVRAFYVVWKRLPYVREGMIGVGVYALTERGRRRFERFPDVIADDGYVRALFTSDERVRVADARVRVAAPATLSDLVRVKARTKLGGYELGRRYPDLVARERRGKAYPAAFLAVATAPWLWPHAVVYLWVAVSARLLGRRRLEVRADRVWERDASSRSVRPAADG